MADLYPASARSAPPDSLPMADWHRTRAAQARGVGPFSVPDPLADEWDDMVQRNRLLKAPNDPEFGPDDPATQIPRQHDHIQDVRDKIAASPPQVGQTLRDDYSLRGLNGVPEFLKDYSAIPSGGAAGNLAAAYLGSYGLTHKVRNVDANGVATVEFHADNSSSLASAVHVPYLGYLPWAEHHVDPAINGLIGHGPGSPTRQTFTWSEKIPLNRGAMGTNQVR